MLGGGESTLEAIGLPLDTLRELGFEVAGERVRLPADVECLDRSVILSGLSARARGWIRDLVTLEIVGSTNTLLNDMATRGSIHGVVRLAELQVAGRGRRGRSWLSPYAGHLALSLGVRLPQTPERLGGFSLCVGLAVADRLQALGVQGVELKWPNDVLVGGRKLSGILIELHRSDAGTEVVVGVGINYRLPDAAKSGIGQPVTDLAETGADLSRNQLAAGLISSLVDFVDGFTARGFAPMVGTFDALHRYQGQSCALLLGSETVTGTVRGVTDQGELMLETDGRIRSFGSGEVSLRPI